MLEIIQFIFSSFWVWLGTVIILGIVAQGAVMMVAALVAAKR